ncbi:type II secretion system F family protein [Planctomycetales bacterium ZRK34]|nr:type II secretion system F family protein [Planctomycetales bacterium ZRK34]
MPVFAYTALDDKGQSITGSVVAPAQGAALEQVIERGLHPVRIEARQTTSPGLKALLPGRSKVKSREVESFTRELANLLAAGVSLSRAMQVLSRETSSPAARTLWEQIREQVVGGDGLGDAMAQHPACFTPIQVAMVRAGEQGGFLHVVLAQIAELRGRERELMDRVKAAMIYPAILTALMICVTIFLLTFFIPMFRQIFSDFGSSLPTLTLVLVGISDMIREYGLVVLGVIVGVVILIRRALVSDAGKLWAERVALKTPALGVVISRFALVRFSRMLGTLVGAGVPLVSALRTARDALGNQTLHQAVDRAVDQVQQGESLARSLGQCPALFPGSVVEIVAVAEETGRLDAELIRVAETNEKELDRRLRMLVALLEPLLLMVMAALVGTIVLGMLLPVLTMQDLIK